jgi:hypothetical protein
MVHLTKRIARAKWLALMAACVLVAAAAPCAQASLISAFSTVQMMDEGPYTGYYKYTVEAVWDLTKDLSHMDLLVRPCGPAAGGVFFFDTGVGGPYDGVSMPGNVKHDGFFEPNGDPSIDEGWPVIKYEPRGDVGKQGVGTFWFYTNLAPIFGLHDDMLVAKHGTNVTYGDIEGAWLSCATDPPHPVPEPASLALVCGGAAFVWIARRRRVRR